MANFKVIELKVITIFHLLCVFQIYTMNVHIFSINPLFFLGGPQVQDMKMTLFSSWHIIIYCPYKAFFLFYLYIYSLYFHPYSYTPLTIATIFLYLVHITLLIYLIKIFIPWAFILAYIISELFEVSKLSVPSHILKIKVNSHKNMQQKYIKDKYYTKLP